MRDLQLREEREKVRVLEESLRVLATEHHDLEESIASHVSSNGSSLYNTPANSYVSLPRPRRFFDAVSDDEFFDAFSQGLLLLLITLFSSLFCFCILVSSFLRFTLLLFAWLCSGSLLLFSFLFFPFLSLSYACVM